MVQHKSLRLWTDQAIKYWSLCNGLQFFIFFCHFHTNVLGIGLLFFLFNWDFDRCEAKTCFCGLDSVTMLFQLLLVSLRSCFLSLVILMLFFPSVEDKAKSYLALGWAYKRLGRILPRFLIGRNLWSITFCTSQTKFYNYDLETLELSSFDTCKTASAFKIFMSSFCSFLKLPCLSLSHMGIAHSFFVAL